MSVGLPINSYQQFIDWYERKRPDINWMFEIK